MRCDRPGSDFSAAWAALWQELGPGGKMVLSTSLHAAVTSRTMSVVILDGKFYFQTDRTFRKYPQLTGNPNVALCIDNLQVEGRCRELGHPSGFPDFLRAYQRLFPGSFARYSGLENERLFAVTPTFVERWRYIDGIPYVEVFDVARQTYELRPYLGAQGENTHGKTI